MLNTDFKANGDDLILAPSTQGCQDAPATQVLVYLSMATLLFGGQKKPWAQHVTRPNRVKMLSQAKSRPDANLLRNLMPARPKPDQDSQRLKNAN